MRSDELQRLLRRQPFEPFRIFVTDGASFEVRHPGMALLTHHEIVVGIPGQNGGQRVADTYEIITLLHVTRVEPIRAEAPGA